MNTINDLVAMPEIRATQPRTLGQKIRTLRIQQGMTKTELSQRTGLTMFTLRLIEADQTGEPKLETLTRIFDALGYSLRLTVVKKGEGNDVHSLPEDSAAA